MRRWRRSVAPTWRTNSHFDVAAAPPRRGGLSRCRRRSCWSRHVFAVARHRRLPSYARLYFFARSLVFWTLNEYARTLLCVRVRACVMDRWAMATEIRRFLPSSRAVYGLDIVSISLNFFLRSAYAGNRNGAWGGQVVVTNKPVTWLPFDHLGKVRILACPHWSWVAHPPSLTQLVEFEGFSDLSCILSSNGSTSPSVRSLNVNVLAHQQWVSSFTLTCCYGMCLQSLISYSCSIISFPNRSVGAYSILEILPVDYLDLFVCCCTTSFQYLILRIPLQWA